MSDETPIAVADYGGYPRRPRENDANVMYEIFADGRVRSEGRWQPDWHMTPEQVRQLCAQLEFGVDGVSPLDWHFALQAANHRRDRTGKEPRQ